MKRQEALELVGKPVSAWTAANGVYAGTLVEVLPTRPWRAKVLISGVLKVATHYELGATVRRGFRPGETIEVGGSSVRPLEADKAAEATDYLTALARERDQHQAWLERDPDGRYAWTHKGSIGALEMKIAEEQARLQAAVDRAD